MPTTSGSVGVEFALNHRELKELLADIRIKTRTEKQMDRDYRKIRPKFNFKKNSKLSDGKILSDCSLSYDITRVLLVCIIDLLDSERWDSENTESCAIYNWPEIVKSCLYAYNNKENVIDNSSNSTNGSYGYVETLGLYGYYRGSWAKFVKTCDFFCPFDAIDCQPIIDTMQDIFPNFSVQLSVAMDVLERTYGVAKVSQVIAPELPTRLDDGFFGSGPYFERARRLLNAEKPDPYAYAQIEHLQALLDYLESPPPTDSWKPILGTEKWEPRLVHLLAARGLELGLESRMVASETLLSGISASNTSALELIQFGEQHLSKLTGAPPNS